MGCDAPVLVESRIRHEGLLWTTAFKSMQYMSLTPNARSLSNSLIPRASIPPSLWFSWLPFSCQSSGWSHVENNLGSSVRLHQRSPQSLPNNITVILGECQALLSHRLPSRCVTSWWFHWFFASDICWWLSAAPWLQPTHLNVLERAPKQPDTTVLWHNCSFLKHIFGLYCLFLPILD